jgi:hypothetical protein
VALPPDLVGKWNKIVIRSEAEAASTRGALAVLVVVVIPELSLVAALIKASRSWLAVSSMINLLFAANHRTLARSQYYL